MNRTRYDQLRKGAVLFLLFCCFGIMVYGYALKRQDSAYNPPEVLFQTGTGPIVFSHQHHYSDDGGGMGCTDCHHNSSGAEDDTSEMKCRHCHYNNPALVKTVCADDEIHPKCIGKQCMICHDGEECTFCHRKRR